MKVAVPTEGEYISGHFGHCPHFTIAEIDGGEVKDVRRIESPEHQPGILPVFLRERGVDCVIAGGMGGRAIELFSQNNIQTVVGVQGKVREALELFAAGKLAGGESMCTHDGQGGHGGCGGHG